MRKNRKNRLNPGYILLLLVVICIAAIGGGIFGGLSVPSDGNVIGIVLAPMQEGVNTVGSLISGIAQERESVADLEEENRRLREEIDDLEARLSSMENNLSDYEDLLSLLALSEKYPTYDTVGARIIGKDSTNWYDTFTIDKGSDDGICVDMNVIADGGLVGIITNVTPSTAVVRSIIDDTSNVSAMISKNLDVCIVNGDLTMMDSGLLGVELISKESTVVSGDEVVTSYISDKYLPGILIGYINEITSDPLELTINATLTPVVDFQHLSNVLVITTLKSDLTSDESAENGGSGDAGDGG